MSFAEALWEKKGEGYRRMKKRRSYWFRKRDFKVRSNREEEGRETKRQFFPAAASKFRIKLSYIFNCVNYV